MEDFSHLVVKEYTYWTLSVHRNQFYLGRCVVWCKRADALDLSEATPEEQKELFSIIQAWRKAVTEAFQTDWYNYSFLGNIMRHLHGHLIPRYASSRVFENMTFTDEFWGKHYQENYDFKTPPAVLEAVRLLLREKIS